MVVMAGGQGGFLKGKASCGMNRNTLVEEDREKDDSGPKERYA